jgi:hypothetical protein
LHGCYIHFDFVSRLITRALAHTRIRAHLRRSTTCRPLFLFRNSLE